MISLVGPDRDLFLQGYRSEKLGFGIGAFAYYRRVVENQSQRIFAELRKVAVQLGDSAAATVLEKASAETRFSQAVDMVKDVCRASCGSRDTTLLLFSTMPSVTRFTRARTRAV